jgi:hypothetical protein
VGDVITTTTHSTITIPHDSKLNDYAGQTLRLTIYVYPKDSTTTPSSLATQQIMSFKFVPPVRITTAPDTNWAREKVLTVICDKNYVRCSNIFFKVVKLPTDPNTPVDCDSVFPKSTDLNDRNVLTTATQKWVLTRDGTTVISEHDSQTLCVQAIASRADSAYNAALGPILAAMQKSSSSFDATQYATFSMATQGASTYMCVPKSDIRSLSTFAAAPNTYYAAESFNVDTQSAVIRLNDGGMAGQYLCVYGKSTTTIPGSTTEYRVYSGDKKGRKIYVDRTPPHVLVQFKPLSLSLFFMCSDGEPGEAGITQSGCKDTFGVAYISDIVHFLPALFAGPQSAATWCPPYMTGSGYTMESRQTVTYTGTEVRVLCMRGEDKAGNAAVSMVTVFNGYDMFANALLMYTQK